MTGPRILVPRSVLERIEDERRRTHPLETGGFLEGLLRGHDVEISGLTVAGSQDVASSISFERRSDHHRRQLQATWRQSQGHVSLVGDWHSHPAGHGNPSKTDKRAWAQLARAMRGNGAAFIATPSGLRVFFLKAGFQLQRVCEFRMIEETEQDCIFAKA